MKGPDPFDQLMADHIAASPPIEDLRQRFPRPLPGRVRHTASGSQWAATRGIRAATNLRLAALQARIRGRATC